jgi:putative toxin-antitoxin system antitoxin component (TIGR02293 family)
MREKVVPHSRQSSTKTVAGTRPTAPAQMIADLAADRVPTAPSLQAPPSALEQLARHGYSEDEIHVLVVPKRTLARRRAAKEPLNVEETDKALRLERIAAQAERVFGDRDKAYRWLRKPKRELGGEPPLAFLASETGARVVEEMLVRIDHGIFG